MTPSSLSPLRYALRFLEEKTPQSSARLVAVLLGIAGFMLGVAVGALTIVITVLTWRDAITPELASALGNYLTGAAALSATLIAGGATAILTRKRAPDPTPEEEA